MATRPDLIVNHVHVSERESAHHWPDGQFDDSAWEDCTMVAGVMLARLCLDPTIPYTHREAEALRDDAGEDPLGGTSNHDARRGMSRRYGWEPLLVPNFSELWAKLTPGTAASVQGSMGAFPYGYHLRRHQPTFNGGHDVLAVRVDATDRVWWDDPLAATGSYQGEWVSKADLRRYVERLMSSFTPWSLVASVKRVVAAPETPTEPTGRVRVKAGSWWDYMVTGNKADGYKVSRVQRETDGFSAETGTIVTTTWGGSQRQFRKLTSGAYIGRWVDVKDAGSVVIL